MVDDLVISPVALDLLSALTIECGPDKHPFPPQNICIRPGDVVSVELSETRDECCEGLAWVRWSRAWPSSAGEFPDLDAAVKPCGVKRWAIEFETGIARCVPTPEPDEIVSCDNWNTVALQTFADAAALRRAACRYTASHPTRLVHLGQQSPGSADGGCITTTLTVTISAKACDPTCQGDLS
jgi:hypothetical protein